MDRKEREEHRPRSHRVTLPTDPSEEELARDWTLSDADIAEVLRGRGEDHRRRFAIQLCMLRTHGRFLDSYRNVPLRIVNHLSRQLLLPPVLFLDEPERDATETAYGQRICQYLGYQSFSAEVERQLAEWLQERATEGQLPAELLLQAEDLLRSWKVVLPSPSTLERMVASVVSRAAQDLFERITAALPGELCQSLDALLDVPERDTRSALFRLKEYPPGATAPMLLTYMERYRMVDSLIAGRVDLSGTSLGTIRHLAQLGRRYDVQALKRFQPAKRYAILACFLTEARKTILDHIVEMNDQFLTTLCRKSKRAFEEQYRQLRRRAKDASEVLLASMETLLGKQGTTRQEAFEAWCEEFDEACLRESLSSCREFSRLEDRGYLDQLLARYGHLRRYLPTFFQLPFEAATGSKEIMEGVFLARLLDAGGTERLLRDAPRGFVPAAWRPALVRDDGTVERSVWETSLALAIREALRSGDLFLPESRRHVSFWNLVYSDNKWTEHRDQAYTALSLSHHAEHVLDSLRQEWKQVAEQAEQGLPKNNFAEVHDGELHLKRQDALVIPERVKELRRVIETHLPRIRIEDLLEEVDSWCGFTREFRPLGGYEPRATNLYQTKLAALIAHGTNLGIAAMP